MKHSLWPVSLLLLSASLREGRVTLVRYVRGAVGSGEVVAAEGWWGWDEGGSGRGEVLY